MTNVPEYSYTYEENGITCPARMTFVHPDYPDEYVLVVGDVAYPVGSYVPGWITTSDAAAHWAAETCGYPSTLLSDVPRAVVYKAHVGRPAMPDSLRRVPRSIGLTRADWGELDDLVQSMRLPMGRIVEMLLNEYRKTH